MRCKDCHTEIEEGDEHICKLCRKFLCYDCSNSSTGCKSIVSMGTPHRAVLVEPYDD